MKTRYTHSEEIHNLESPREIVPTLIELFAPQSVVDVGCGIGTFLSCFKDAWVQSVYWVDWDWVETDLVSKYLDDSEFGAHDIGADLSLDIRYDLVLSLEVAEHIDESYADTYIKNLISAWNVIIFSAAIPWQWWQNHVNEQWIWYWQEKFLQHWYHMHDILRPIFWDNPKIFWWYRQNIVVFAAKEYNIPRSVKYNPIKNIIHPELLQHTKNILKKNEENLDRLIKQIRR